MLIDLHCHTQPLSACSSLAVEQLIEHARCRGLDGVCLTEHDRLQPADHVARLAREHGLVVLRGMEVTTELGHALVYGLDTPPAGMFLAAQLRAAVERAGGVMALAHPGRAGQPRMDGATLRRLFDAVEIINGSDGVEENRSAEALTALTALPGIGGSDCHAPHEIGRAATRFAVTVRTEADLVTALRQGHYQAVWLSSGSAKQGSGG